MKTQNGLRRWLPVAIAAAVLMLIASFAVVPMRAGAEWRSMRARGQELRQQWLAELPAARPPLAGDAVEGRAFDCYRRGTAVMQALREHEHELGDLLLLDDAALSHALANDAQPLRELWMPALAELQRGARSIDARQLRSGFGEISGADLLAHRALCNAAMFEARARRYDGDFDSAVLLSLDAMTLGADLISDGVLIDQMVGATLVAIVCEAWSDDALAALPRAPRLQLEAGLEQLDARLPVRVDMTREMIYLAENMRVPDWSESCGGGSWRYGFSQRWMLADAFHRCLDGYRELDTIDSRDWQARTRAFDRFCAEMVDSGNGACAVMVPNLEAAERTLREVVAMVRLLRAALAVHDGAQQVAHQDPFGPAPLQLRPAGDGGIELASVGDRGRGRLSRTVRP